MTAQCKHAKALSTRPDVVAWVRRLQEVARDMPADVQVFIGGGIAVMDLCDEGSSGSSVERNRHIVASVEGSGWDGGDW